MQRPSEDDLHNLIYALGSCDALEARRIARGVRKLNEGKTVDQVLKEDLERARREVSREQNRRCKV